MKKIILLSTLLFAFGFFMVSCGPDDTTPDPDPVDESEEYLIVGGKKIDGSRFSSKLMSSGTITEKLTINFGDTSIVIVHDKGYLKENHEYTVEDISWEDESVLVVMYAGFNIGDHTYGTINMPSTPHEKYMLKKVDGKFVSEFGTLQQHCTKHSTPRDSYAEISGRVVWEDK